MRDQTYVWRLMEIANIHSSTLARMERVQTPQTQRSTAMVGRRRRVELHGSKAAAPSHCFAIIRAASSTSFWALPSQLFAADERRLFVDATWHKRDAHPSISHASLNSHGPSIMSPPELCRPVRPRQQRQQAEQHGATTMASVLLEPRLWSSQAASPARRPTRESS